MFVRNKVSARGFRIGVVSVGDDYDNALPRDSFFLQIFLCQRVPVFPESSPPYFSPSRIVTSLYTQATPNIREPLMEV